MESIRGRALKVGISLIVFFVLFLLTFSQAHAYPAPKFQQAMVFSSQNADGPINTVFFAIISGPSPEDVASFTATGPSGTFTLTSSRSFRELGLYYAGVEGSIVSNGAYTFQVTDTAGNSASVVRDFTYDGTLPQVDSATMLPGDKAYVGTTTPTLSFDPVTGTVYYSVQIRDYDGRAIWYNSPRTTATSFTVPSGLLQPNTAYTWYARVWDRETNPQNVREKQFIFYTGTKGAPEINMCGLLSFPWGEDLLNYPYARGINVAPWDIDYFQVTGPDEIAYELDRRYFRFYFPAYNAAIIQFDPPASLPDGTYTFEIKNDLGQKVSTTKTYTYNPVPDFVEDSRFPADNAYLDTLKPTFNWARVQEDTGNGEYLYGIRIVDYTTKIRWFDSPKSTETSFTPTEPLNLPKGSSYKWQVNVIDAGDNNYRSSGYRVITINEHFLPVPDIKANGSDGPIVISPSTPVSIDISLVPGFHAGANADWWIAVKTPFDPPGDWYTYVHPVGWMPGINLCAQTGLFDVSPFEVLNMTLPVGTYTFYFGLDDPDWAATGPWWGLDSVEVTVGDTPLPTYTNSLGQTFNLLPAGTFTMGSPSDEWGRISHEGPQHQVRLTQPFYMQQTEVTQAQWETVMGSNPSYFPGCPTCPVETVSWNDVQVFITEMNKRGEGTYSLPTEAQWEYGARAGSTTAFYNGEIMEYPNMYDCNYDANLDAIGWYCLNSVPMTHAVAGKTPNAWGLYDMSGNVWEWCSDWYVYDYYANSPADDPQGPSTGAYRVIRGGGWGHLAQNCRSASRGHDPPGAPSGWYGRIGFRLVLFSGQ